MFQSIKYLTFFMLPHLEYIRSYLAYLWSAVYTTDLTNIFNKVPFRKEACVDPPSISQNTVKTTENSNPPTQLSVYVNSYKDKLAVFSRYTRNYTDDPKESDWKHLLNSILMEYTPLGNVLMYYDSSKDSFVYFCDRIIPYECIDTVARRYVLTYNCTKIYVDSTNPDSVLRHSVVVTNPQTDQQEKTAGAKNVLESDKVFAKLKTYRAPKKETISYTDHKINRYTYGGKIANFLFLKKNNPTKSLSYGEFKNKTKQATN